MLNKKVRKLYLFLIIFILVFSGLFSSICCAADNDNLVAAVFDISFISGTQLSVDISVIPEKLTTDRIYYSVDIIHASSEELGALKYAVFLMLKDQLSYLFKGMELHNFSLPTHQSGVFSETLDLTLDSGFFNMNYTVNAEEIINGFLDVGATISYIFPMSTEIGWNNTYSIYLPSDLILDSANTIEVSSDGSIVSWRSINWNGNDPSKEGLLSIRERNPTSLVTEENIKISFEIDGRTPSNIILDSYILCSNLSVVPYEILPECITNIEYLPSDGIRLLIKNKFLSWADLHQKTYVPIIQHVKSVVENSSFNQTYPTSFLWDTQTTINSSECFNISKMDAAPPITGRLSDEEISLSLLGITGRAFFGLLNAGGNAHIDSNDINFGPGFQKLDYPYSITLTLPANIKINEKQVFTWDNQSDFFGNFSSDNYQHDGLTEDHVEEYITVDISKMDLNILSIFTGSLEMNTAITISADEYQFIALLPEGFSFPEKMQLERLNADAFRLCIEESIFSPMHISKYFNDKKEDFTEQLASIIKNIELNAILDENIFFTSLDWDGDISSMDALTPIQTSITSKSLYPIKLNISVFPPSLNIANQTFHLTGSSNKTIIYTIIFPKGISIEHFAINNSDIHKDENADGRQFIEYTIPSPYNTSLSITCQITASPIYILSILLPLILSFVLVTILVILIYMFRKRKRGRPSFHKHPPSQDYSDQQGYIPPPPSQGRS